MWLVVNLLKLYVARRFKSSTLRYAVVMVHTPKKEFYRKFIYEPFPVESSLHEQLTDHLNAEASEIGHSLPQCRENLLNHHELSLQIFSCIPPQSFIDFVMLSFL